jgi:glycopeptide antibiotics resistance protein
MGFYLVALAWLTLTPGSTSGEALSILRRLLAVMQSVDALSWVTFDTLEFTANIALFVPMGVLVTLLLGRRGWWAALAVGVIASCWIELAQYVWLPSRVADPRDLVSNSIGTALGVLVVLVATWPQAQRARSRAASSRSASHAEA